MEVKRHSFKVAAAIATGVLLLTAAVVVASPGSGITSVSNRADGTADGRFKVNIPGTIKLEAHGDLRVFDQELTILPAGHTGWHSHPGPVLVTVKSGTFRYQNPDCSYTDYTAGQTVVDEGGGHVHIGRNPSGSASTDLSITYLVPPGVPLRSEADVIVCP
jgi:quercetin dioxygenase-like cupin family protein